MTGILAVRYGASISEEDVTKTSKNIDPDGATIRRKKVIRRMCHIIGPGCIYYIARNDKLERCGVFPFTGALIDSVVRSCGRLYQHIFPLLVGNFYLSYIQQPKIVIKLSRITAGTENVYHQDLQVYFIGEEGSFYARNQRIEAFW